MPLIMDEDMEVDMDDLFGDGADLSLPSRAPPTIELLQRVDELRASGSCQCVGLVLAPVLCTDRWVEALLGQEMDPLYP